MLTYTTLVPYLGTLRSFLPVGLIYSSSSCHGCFSSCLSPTTFSRGFSLDYWSHFSLGTLELWCTMTSLTTTTSLKSGQILWYYLCSWSPQRIRLQLDLMWYYFLYSSLLFSILLSSFPQQLVLNALLPSTTCTGIPVSGSTSREPDLRRVYNLSTFSWQPER